jgi:hypothetical protein
VHNAPKLPPQCSDLWRIFLEIHRSRDGMGGPIRFSDLHAYEQVTGLKLAPWELRAIRAADDCYLTREAERLKRD